jgi:hypothetical protein
METQEQRLDELAGYCLMLMATGQPAAMAMALKATALALDSCSTMWDTQQVERCAETLNTLADKIEARRAAQAQ